MTNLTKSQIQKIPFLNECLKSSKSEKITIGVIGGVKSYNELLSITRFLEIEKKIEVIYLNDTIFDNGCEFNIISIDEMKNDQK